MAEDKAKLIEITQLPPEVQLKYLGMDVAIVNGQVVAAGRNSIEARDNTMKVCPRVKRLEITVRYVPDLRDNAFFVPHSDYYVARGRSVA